MIIIHANFITFHDPYPWGTMLNRHVHPALSIDLLTQGIDVLILSFTLHYHKLK